jgi:hypothetical protein
MLQGRLPVEQRVRPPMPIPAIAGHDIRSPAEKTIALFYADLAPGLKQATFEQFLSGECRILVATDAFGAGMDIPHIKRVIQWGVGGVDDLDTLVQRFGRCARNSELQGMCILYYEETYHGTRSQDLDVNDEETQSAGRTSQTTKRNRRKPVGKSQTGTKRTPLDTRNAMDPGLWKFINTDDGCRRMPILEYYADPALDAEYMGVLATGPCCDLDSEDAIMNYPCAEGCPEFPRTLAIDPDENHTSQAVRVKAPSERQKEATLEALRSWRRDVYKKDWKAKGVFMPDWILSDKSLSRISANCTRITNIESLLATPGFSWDSGHQARYGKVTLIPTILNLTFYRKCGDSGNCGYTARPPHRSYTEA